MLRRIHGVPQMARELGVSEDTVEIHAKRGLKIILRALESDGSHADEGLAEDSHGNSRETALLRAEAALSFLDRGRALSGDIPRPLVLTEHIGND